MSVWSAFTRGRVRGTLHPMPSYREIYDHHAAQYEELVRHEDHQGNLRAWLERAFPAPVKQMVELGCGTGRVTRLLAPLARSVHAYDGAAHMIAHAEEHAALPGVTYAVASNEELPEAARVADAVVAGWTIGHVTGFYSDGDWAPHAGAMIGEMERVAASGARIVIIETLGTCTTVPAPPNPKLESLYHLFEHDRGLTRHVLDTSYAFASLEEAQRIMGFFFGESMRERVAARGSHIVPEWTGVWTRTLT